METPTLKCRKCKKPLEYLGQERLGVTTKPPEKVIDIFICECGKTMRV